MSTTGVLTDLGASLGVIATLTPSAEESTSTSYTFVLTDRMGCKVFTSSSAVTATVPLNSSVAFPEMSTLTVMQKGTGQVTIAATGGVTIRYPATKNAKVAEQYGVVQLVKIDTDEWILTGYLETP